MTTTGRPPLSIGKYELVELLGSGGFAEAWKARVSGAAGFSRTLVVKRILPTLASDPHFLRMFLTEARLSALLHHPNIVQVFELGEAAGEHYLAMEYLRGCHLGQVVRAHLAATGAPPPVGFGAFVVREVCRALAYAHALTDDGAPLRLIHRDVSPPNVMLCFDGTVKLLDFGVAKAMAEVPLATTDTGEIKGKPAYCAPEQLAGEDVDHRIDQFAVGVVLHEVLTGRRLFRGANQVETLGNLLHAKVDPPSILNPEVPPELDRICMRALARDRAARYASCDEMVTELDAVVRGYQWESRQLSALLAEVLPPSATVPVELPARSAAVAPPHGSRRGMWRWNFVVGAAVLITGSLALGVLAGRRPPSPPTAARPPAAVPAELPAPIAPTPQPADGPSEPTPVAKANPVPAVTPSPARSRPAKPLRSRSRGHEDHDVIGGHLVSPFAR